MKIDAKALATYPQVIVATPGRLCDHLDRGNIWLDYIEIVVLDEADRMLDMGFNDQLTRIMTDVPKSRQTLLFSATMAPSVENLARKILHDPERITIGKAGGPANKSVEQRLIWMSEEAKTRELRRLLRDIKGTIIVFTRSKDGATRVWRSLHSAGMYDVTYIHSDRRQEDREQALAEFKEGKYRVLIATDVAGRGIHIDDVEHVINYDLPMEPEDYVHRIGRTGRAGATGHATTFATPRDRGIVKQIEKLLGKEIPSQMTESFNEPSQGRPGGGHGGARLGPREPEPRGGGRSHARSADRTPWIGIMLPACQPPATLRRSRIPCAPPWSTPTAMASQCPTTPSNSTGSCGSRAAWNRPARAPLSQATRSGTTPRGIPRSAWGPTCSSPLVGPGATAARTGSGWRAG